MSTRRMVRGLVAGAAAVSITISPNFAAAGIPVIDWANIAQSTISAVKDVEQASQLVLSYKTQLEQYERMLTDAVVPAVFVWDSVNNTINNLKQARASLASRDSIRGLARDELKKLSDPDFYRSSSCYNLQGAQGECFKAYREFLDAQRDLEKQVDDAHLEELQRQEGELSGRYDRLDRLQHNTQSAKGQLEATQYANQLASAQVTELMDTRALLLAQQRAEAEERRLQLTREAAEAAAAARLRDSKFQKSPQRDW
jgi:P-type conjugative transfer protein TrbJ